MKSLKSFWSLFAAIAFLFAGNALAQTPIAYDDAGNYQVAANWTNGSNRGYGFTPWAIVTNGPNSHGNYVNSPAVTPPFAMASFTNVNSTNYTNVWGIYANGSGNINTTMATRGFSNSLGTNTFKVQWTARGAGSTVTTNAGTVHGWCGVTLRNGNTTNSASDFTTGARFQLFFFDGNNPASLYVIDGSNNNFQYALTGTSFSDLGRSNGTNAVQVELTVGADGDHYHLVLKDIVRGRTIYTLDSILAGTSGSSIDSAALFCQETTGDQDYNRMQIAPPTLVPPTIVNVKPTNGTLYVGSTNLTFEVDSFTTTVSSNFVSVFLNGIQQSNLTFNTTSPASQLLGTCTAPLTPNTFYTYLITAQDANGNIASNITTFNTFLTTDLYIDAADYNYSNGLFIANYTPSDAYQNLLGVQNVDYFILDTTGTNNLAGYRPGDLPEILTLNTDATGDPIDHANLRLNSGTSYNLGFTDTGNWENYTRTIAVATNYSIYARAASTTGGQFEVEELVNPTALTSNQPLAALGRVNFLNTGGSKVYTGQLTPVADIFGNTVVVPLSGTKTIRTTAVASRIYDLEYLVVVPVVNTNTLRPYISVASPVPNATGIAIDSPISFTVANRQTSVSNLQVSLNGTNITVATIANAVGTVATYTPSSYLAGNTTNNLSVIITDGTNVKTTNTWSFVSINVSNVVVPTTFAQPIASAGSNGFALSVYKMNDNAPVVGTLANTFKEVAGQLIDTNSSTPYINVLNSTTNAVSLLETNVIAYDITGSNTGTFTFTNCAPIPGVPVSGTNNNIALQALTYLQLTNGSYHFAVRSDDGFELTTGLTPASTNLVLGLFDGGRANTTPTDIYFTIQTNGLYPMSLLYMQEQFGGNVEFYSIVNGTPILINDRSNANSIKAFSTLASALANPVTILSPAHTAGVTTFSFVTQSGHTHFVEYKNLLSDPSWSPVVTITGSGSSTNVTDSTATPATRFYRVRTQ